MNKGNKTMKEKKREETTKTEQKILLYVAAGYTDKEISKETNINYSTVRNSLRQLFLKSKTVNRPHLVSWAYKEGILKI